MNIRRGFWRLWIVVSLLWAAVFTITFGSPLKYLPEIQDGWKAQSEASAAREAAKPKTGKLLITSLQAKAIVEAKIRRGKEAERSLKEFAQIIVVPALILLLLGAAIGWAISGFRRQ